MVNRHLCLLVAAVAPASAAAMLVSGAHTIGAVTLAERGPCIGLAVLALALAIAHSRIAPRRHRAEAAMWWGLSSFLVVAAFASPHLGLWAITAALSLAATSVARLVASQGRGGGLSKSPFRRRIFA